MELEESWNLEKVTEYTSFCVGNNAHVTSCIGQKCHQVSENSCRHALFGGFIDKTAPPFWLYILLSP